MSVGDFEVTRETESESEFADQAILCVDCSCDFVWTAGEQSFYRDKGLVNPPKRCKSCKKMKNERLAAVETAQLTGRRQRVEVSAQCAQCSTITTVPFYPSQGRPVYCRACFRGLPASSNGAGA